MRTVRVICVGKLKERFYADACAEYVKRLSAFCKLEIVELVELTAGERRLEREGEAVLAAIPAGSAVVSLCVEGALQSSEELSAYLSRRTVGGASRFVFILGSSEGLAEEVKRASELRLSMSPMTFPHHLARVMLLEQLYRAFQIEAGGKYHK